MKFKIKLDTFQDYLKRLSISVQTVSSRIELTGILITANDNSVTFEGRNDFIDTRIEETNLSNIKVVETGRALLKASTLNEIVQKMTGEFVELTKIDSSILVIKSQDSKYDVNLLTDENYESATYVNEFENEVSILPSTFRDAIHKVVFAGNEFHSKFIFQGINLLFNQGKLTSTVCDGIRIASFSTTINSQSTISKIIPLKVVKELVKVLPSSNEYKFGFNKGKGIVTTSNTIIQFTMIEGTFPTFEKLFNGDDYTKKLVISRELFLNSIERATILNVNKADSGNRVGILISDNEFTLESREQEIGSAKIVVDEYEYNGDNEISISLSSKYLVDGLKSFTSETVTVYFKESQSSVYIKSDDDSLQYILSPMV